MPLLPPSGIGDFRVQQTHYHLSLSTPLSIAANSPTRIFIGFSPSTNGILVSILPTISAIIGINLGTTAQPYDLLWSTHGALVNQQWYGFSGGAADITVTEVFYEPKSLKEQ